MSTTHPNELYVHFQHFSYDF